MTAEIAQCDPLPPFDPTRSCPKCRGDEVRTTYVPTNKSGHYLLCDAGRQEHLDRTCQRCHYGWAEACEDTPTDQQGVQE